MGLKSRIVANTKPLAPPPVPKPSVTMIPAAKRLRPQALFGDPLNLVPQPLYNKAPAFLGYAHVATWRVDANDTALAAVVATMERIGNVHTLYHGTAATNIASIAREGLKRGSNACMFGAGIYLGGPSKAMGYTRGERKVHYLLEVDVALGKIKPCMAAEKHDATRLAAEGYDSVGGFAGQTVGWHGALRHNEYVVYSRDQAIVTRVLEYHYVGLENPVTSTLLATEGACALIVNHPTNLTGTFADVLSRKPCGKKAYTKVEVRQLDKRKPTVHTVWFCAACVEAHKLRHGSKVEVLIATHSWYPVKAAQVTVL